MRNSDFGSAWGDRLDDVAHTDLLLDALAARTEGDFSAPTHDPLTALLGDWRDDLRWPPASALVSQEEAEDALRAGMMNRGRGRRGLAAVGSVAATLLMLSGFGAVIADARPGDLLYGLHAMMFNEPRVSDDQIMLSAKADLAKVQQMIAQGQWDQAQTQLAEVSSTLQGVNDGSRRQGLLDEVTQLNTKVEKRDPNATVRPASPPSGQLAPEAPANSWTPPAAPAPELTEPGTTVASPTPTPITTPPAEASTTQSTTPTEPTTPTTTTKHRHSSTTPSPSTTPSTPSSTPTQSSKGKPKPSTSAPPTSPTSPVAAPGSPTASTPSGQLWDRTSGAATPRTPFPAGPTP